MRRDFLRVSLFWGPERYKEEFLTMRLSLSGGTYTALRLVYVCGEVFNLRVTLRLVITCV